VSRPVACVTTPCAALGLPRGRSVSTSEARGLARAHCHARIARGDVLPETKAIVSASPGTSPDTLIVHLRMQGTEHVVAEMNVDTRSVERVLLSTRNSECAKAVYEYERDRLRREKARHLGSLSPRSLSKERPEPLEHKAARLRREAAHARSRGREDLAEYLENQANGLGPTVSEVRPCR